MRRTLLLVILIAVCGLLSAQTGNLRFPVRLTDGSPIRCFEPDREAERKLLRDRNVRYIRILDIEPRADGRPDTFSAWSEGYTPQGDVMPLDRQRGDFDGKNQIVYDRHGRMIRKDWMFDRIEGCGNGHWRETGGNSSWYSYDEHGKLILESHGGWTDRPERTDTTVRPWEFKAWRYDAKGRLKVRSKYHIFSPGGDTSSLDDAEIYACDRKGRPLHVFLADEDSLRNPGGRPYKRADSLLALVPPDFCALMLRQDEWGDSLKARTYGDPDTMSEDAYDRMTDEIAVQDSLDEIRSAFFSANHDHYNALIRGYIGYQYDNDGLLTGRSLFKQNGLSRKDSFTYNRQKQLVRWSIWELDDPGRNGPFRTESTDWIKGDWTCWNFEYDKQGRVKKVWSAAYSANDTHRYEQRLMNTLSVTLSYNKDGSAATIDTDSWEYRNPQSESVLGPASQEQRSYIVSYERYGRGATSFRDSGR